MATIIEVDFSEYRNGSLRAAAEQRFQAMRDHAAQERCATWNEDLRGVQWPDSSQYKYKHTAHGCKACNPPFGLPREPELPQLRMLAGLLLAACGIGLFLWLYGGM